MTLALYDADTHATRQNSALPDQASAKNAESSLRRAVQVWRDVTGLDPITPVALQHLRLRSVFAPRPDRDGGDATSTGPG